MPDADLREIVTSLAALDRRAGSPGETEAAHRLVDHLAAAGAEARVEAARFRDGYARQLTPLGLAGTIAGAVALTGRGRRVAGAIAALGALALADDIDNRRRVWRRLVTRESATTNVVAELGDVDAARTLVVLAHHDAAPTGAVFDQSLQRALARRFPALVERSNTSLPLWWPIVGAPVAIALGATVGSRRLLAAGVATGVVTTAVGADIARNRVVPGANDNLSGAAALVGLADRVREHPISGLRIVLASCGAEEVLQGGIYDFVDCHLRPLDPGQTWVLNLDTVGSPRLVLVEGEGVFRVEEYTDPSFRDLVAAAAHETEIPLVRGLRSRSSTDSVIPSRAGYPTATVASFEPDTKLLSNYHLLTDTPENVDFDTIAQAVDLADAVARRLAAANTTREGPDDAARRRS
jgi:hypothetical protein